MNTTKIALSGARFIARAVSYRYRADRDLDLRQRRLFRSMMRGYAKTGVKILRIAGRENQ